MSTISLAKVEQQNLNCIWDCPEYIYKFDREYFLSSVAGDIFYTLKKLFEGRLSPP